MTDRPSDRPTSDADKLTALRELLPATGAGIYLDTATRGPLPAETAAAVRADEDWELRVGRVTAGREEDVSQRAAETRAVLAALLVADSDDVIVTTGLEAALDIAAAVPDWQPGDRALIAATAGAEARAVVHRLHALRGVTVDVVDADDSAALADAQMPGTRLVIVPHVAPTDGRLFDPRPLAGGEPLIVLDASLSAGAVALDVGQLGADMVALAGERWLLGPEATGGLWCGPRVPVARRLGLGLPARSALLGLARSVGWLEMYVGLEWAYERTRRLASSLHTALSQVDGVAVLTPVDRLATVVSFQVANWPADDAADELGGRAFAIVRPLPELDAIRASVAWFNSEDEIDRFVRAVDELARHTPQSLPRRPALHVIQAE
jgi:cysteine desulfurase / selenocysteine lyase